MHADVGMNNDQMHETQADLLPPPEHGDAGHEMEVDGPLEHGFTQHPAHPQDSISFDQSRSTTHYIQAHGPCIVLRVEDVLSSNFGSVSSSSSSSSSDPEVQSSATSIAFQIAERFAF